MIWIFAFLVAYSQLIFWILLKPKLHMYLLKYCEQFFHGAVDMNQSKVLYL